MEKNLTRIDYMILLIGERKYLEVVFVERELSMDEIVKELKHGLICVCFLKSKDNSMKDLDA